MNMNHFAIASMSYYLLPFRLTKLGSFTSAVVHFFAILIDENQLLGTMFVSSMTSTGPLETPTVGMTACRKTYTGQREVRKVSKLARNEQSPPWPSGLKRWNQTLVPVVRARFEPRCGRPHFAPTHSGVRVCGRNRTETREREWAEGTVSSLPGTLNVRIKFCHSTGIARSGGGVRASTTSYA